MSVHFKKEFTTKNTKIKQRTQRLNKEHKKNYNSLAPARLALAGCLTAVDPAAATPNVCFIKKF
jgi:hypothetical protein